MARVGKALLVAVGLSVAAASAAADPAPAAKGEAQSAEAKLQALLATIEQQSVRLAQQQADIERQRSDLEKQKAELLALKASLNSTTALVASAQPASLPVTAPQPSRSKPVRVEFAKTKYGYIPLPRRAPRDGDVQVAEAASAPPAAARTVASAAPPARQQIAEATSPVSAAAPAPGAPAAAKHTDRLPMVGRSAKNDLGIPAPDSPSAPAPTEAKAIRTFDSRRVTLADLVRAAKAPTLAGQSQTATPQQVGEEPTSDQSSIDIAVLADRGGVLTPKGTLVIDPSIDYTHSSVNRFFFDGVEIAEAVLIGDFQAQDIDRDSVTTGLGLRYGLTKRLEVDAGVSWIYRHDRTFNKNLTPGSPDVNLALSGTGLGDVDFGIHYQINKPKGLFPYFVANLRAKSDTGVGPYDVDRDLQTGLEQELPSGSGFWSVEPSVTMIFPSDPAVLFANIGYQYSVKKDINKIILDNRTPTVAPNSSIGTMTRREILVGEVDPGDAISASVGMGIGVNDAVSISFGYQHTWVLETATEQTTSMFDTPLDCVPSNPPDVSTCILGGGVETLTSRTIGTSHSTDAQLGSLLMGASINLSENVGINFNVSAGLTSDAPDVQLSFRTPLSFRLFD